MKKKMTRADAQRLGYPVLRVGADALQYLLVNHEPVGYNSGMYGWNWDAYYVHGVVIVTGYRNLPGVVPYGYSEYDAEARKVLSSDAPYRERAEKVEQLLMRFCRNEWEYHHVVNGGKVGTL